MGIKTKSKKKILKGFKPLDQKKIFRFLKNKKLFAQNQLLIFDELASTNTYLTELTKTKSNCSVNQTKSFVCFAEAQTAGRGRQGKPWFSPPNCNIYLSLSWQFTRPIQELSSLGLVIGIAIIEALKKYGVKSKVLLKWPNDILWQNRKLAGILIEVSKQTSQIHQAIIGIGLNVNMPKKAQKNITQPWCDLKEIIKSTPNRNRLAGILLDQILKAIFKFERFSLKPFIKKWQKYDSAIGKKVKIFTGQQSISGTALGINNLGHFLFKDSNGQSRSLASGEVSMRIDV